MHTLSAVHAQQKIFTSVQQAPVSLLGLSKVILTNVLI